MKIRDGVTLSAPARNGTAFSLEVSDVTGTHQVTATDLQPEAPAGAVATALASRMSLPMDVPWTLRDESSAAYLDDALPIGEQIADQSQVTLTPKTHLG